MRGCVDLDRMVGVVDHEAHSIFPQHPIALGRLCEMYIRLHLEKDLAIRTSNWENDLIPAQIECPYTCRYRCRCQRVNAFTDAANDAAVALSIFQRLRALIPTPSEYEDSTGEFDVVAGVEVVVWLK